jgi:hypothetical protein
VCVCARLCVYIRVCACLCACANPEENEAEVVHHQPDMQRVLALVIVLPVGYHLIKMYVVSVVFILREGL